MHSNDHLNCENRNLINDISELKIAALHEDTYTSHRDYDDCYDSYVIYDIRNEYLQACIEKCFDKYDFDFQERDPHGSYYDGNRYYNKRLNSPGFILCGTAPRTTYQRNPANGICLDANYEKFKLKLLSVIIFDHDEKLYMENVRNIFNSKCYLNKNEFEKKYDLNLTIDEDMSIFTTPPSIEKSGSDFKILWDNIDPIRGDKYLEIDFHLHSKADSKFISNEKFTFYSSFKSKESKDYYIINYVKSYFQNMLWHKKMIG